MSYRISLRPGHPKGQFRRDGHLFFEGAPQLFEVLSAGLRREQGRKGSWLVIEAVAPPEPQEAPAAPPDLEGLHYAQLLRLARQSGICFEHRPRKVEVLQALAALPKVERSGLKQFEEGVAP